MQQHSIRAAAPSWQTFEGGSSLGRRSTRQRRCTPEVAESAVGRRTVASASGSASASQRRDDAFRDARLVEVLRDAAAEERVAGAEDQAGVDLRRARTTPSSRRCAASSASASRIRSWISSTVARPSSPRATGNSPSASACERRREREAVREGGVSVSEHVVRDTRADHREQRGGGHRDPEPERGLVGLLERVAALERLHQHRGLAGQHPVDDEGRRVLHEHAALAELPRHVPGRRERRRRPSPARARPRPAAAPRPG